MDWSVTPDDPSGYSKLRSFLETTAAKLDALSISTAARLRSAARDVDLPSVWMGDAGLAIRETLSERSLPEDLRADLASALEAIREGFRRVGTEPVF